MRRATILLLSCLSAAAASGCGTSDAAPAAGALSPAQTTAPATDASATAPVATAATRKRTGAKVAVRGTRFGRILVDGRGHALYLFTADRTPQSRCDGACAAAWPPFLTKGSPRAGRGARARLLGTTRRADGKRQVTYRGHPLYFYVGDREPGQVLCQDVFEFGGRWLVVAPSGAAIT